MAYAIRIDSVVVISGQVNVYYTAGILPLPDAPSGSVRTFTSKTQLSNAVKALASSTAVDTLALLLLARALKRDATVAKGFAAFAAGDEIHIDLDSDSLVTVAKSGAPKQGMAKMMTLVDMPGLPIGTTFTLNASNNYIGDIRTDVFFSVSYVLANPEMFGPA